MDFWCWEDSLPDAPLPAAGSDANEDDAVDSHDLPEKEATGFGEGTSTHGAARIGWESERGSLAEGAAAGMVPFG